MYVPSPVFQRIIVSVLHGEGKKQQTSKYIIRTSTLLAIVVEEKLGFSRLKQFEHGRQPCLVFPFIIQAQQYFQLIIYIMPICLFIMLQYWHSLTAVVVAPCLHTPVNI